MPLFSSKILTLLSVSFLLILPSYANEIAKEIAKEIAAAEARAQTTAEMMLNEVNYLVSEDSSISEIRGIIKPSKKAILSSEIKAPIIKIHFGVGEKFNKGDILIEFDNSVYQSQYEAQSAISKSQKIVYENQLELYKLDGITETELRLSELKTTELESLLEKEKFLLDQCIIKAPYDGVVIEKFVNEYELVTLDKQLIQIIASNNPELELIVPSSWVSWLKTGKEFEFVIDETQRTYSIKVLRTSGIIDAVSRTIKVICEFSEPDEFLVIGMTGTANFTQD